MIVSVVLEATGKSTILARSGFEATHLSRPGIQALGN